MRSSRVTKEMQFVQFRSSSTNLSSMFFTNFSEYGWDALDFEKVLLFLQLFTLSSEMATRDDRAFIVLM